MNSPKKLTFLFLSSIQFLLNGMEKTEDLPFEKACRQILCLKVAQHPFYKDKQRDRDTLDCSEQGISEKDDLERHVKQKAIALALDNKFRKPTDADLKYFSVFAIKLNRNALKELPESLVELASELTSLDISLNKFDKLPPVILQLTNLRDLNIANGGILQIPKDDLKALTALTRLTMSLETGMQFKESGLPFSKYDTSVKDSDWDNSLCGNMGYMTYTKK